MKNMSAKESFFTFNFYFLIHLIPYFFFNSLLMAFLLTI